MKRTELLVPEVSFDDDGADFAAILTRKLHINRTTIKIESAGGIDSWGEIPSGKPETEKGQMMICPKAEICPRASKCTRAVPHKLTLACETAFANCLPCIPINKEEK